VFLLSNSFLLNFCKSIIFISLFSFLAISYTNFSTALFGVDLINTGNEYFGITISISANKNSINSSKSLTFRFS